MAALRRRLNKNTTKQQQQQQKSILLQWGLAAGIVVLSVVWQQNPTTITVDHRDELVRTLLSSSSKVAIRDSPLGGTGLFSTQFIPKNSVIVQIPLEYKITPALVENRYPYLGGMVDRALLSSLHEVVGGDASSSSVPSRGQILTVLAALLEYMKGEASIFHSYFSILPRNVSSMAFYWTKEELQCVVYPKDAMDLQTNLKIFKTVMATIVDQFPPLQHNTTTTVTTTAEWLYVMVKTRGFGNDGVLIPILDSTNHDPTLAVSPFVPMSSLPHRGVIENAHYLIATHDIPPNTEIFNSYSDYLSPTIMAAHYGFVVDTTATQKAAFVDSYTIHQDMIQQAGKKGMKNTPFIEQCTTTTSNNALFYGNVTPSLVVEAHWMGASKSIQFVPFQPTPSTYDCLCWMLNNTTDRTKVFKYIVTKLQTEIARYEEIMVTRKQECQEQSERGNNFALIHETNVVMADLLRGVVLSLLQEQEEATHSS
jgi:hypothetical protein